MEQSKLLTLYAERGGSENVSVHYQNKGAGSLVRHVAEIPRRNYAALLWLPLQVHEPLVGRQGSHQLGVLRVHGVPLLDNEQDKQCIRNTKARAAVLVPAGDAWFTIGALSYDTRLPSDGVDTPYIYRNEYKSTTQATHTHTHAHTQDRRLA